MMQSEYSSEATVSKDNDLPSCASQQEAREVGAFPRTYIAGVRFDRATRSQALERMAAFIREGGTHIVSAPNIDYVAQCQTNGFLLDFINDCDLSVADGMAVIYISRLLGEPLPQNVAGRPLCVEFCRLASQRGYRVCLVGGGPGIAEKAADALCRKFPGLSVVGAFAPPVGFDLEGPESNACVERVRRRSPDALFVAFGGPKQEMWLSRNRQRLSVSVCMGVGGAFDVVAGKYPLPPAWATRVGLEWLFRLVHDPVRLGKRYLVRDLKFVLRLLAQVAQERLKRPRPSAE